MINKININIKSEKKVFKKLLILINEIEYKKMLQTKIIIKPKKPFGKNEVIISNKNIKTFKPGWIL